jgi:hypothetical protein
MFPLMIYQRKNTVNLRNHTPTISRLSQKASDAKTIGNKEICEYNKLERLITVDLCITFYTLYIPYK